jgi:hypothetical protein
MGMGAMSGVQRNYFDDEQNGLEQKWRAEELF